MVVVPGGCRIVEAWLVAAVAEDAWWGLNAHQPPPAPQKPKFGWGVSRKLPSRDLSRIQNIQNIQNFTHR